MPGLVVPEVIQTSSMDCGPAALKAMLAGHRVHVDYERLRDACETTVDGTSIDALERLAALHGLDCEQLLVPIDQLLAKDAGALPAIVVTQLPSGVPHFVVAWRVHGPFVQVMDPHAGRRWLRRSEFLSQVYSLTHEMAVDDWEGYARSESFGKPLLAKLRMLGLSRGRAKALLDRAKRSEGWYGLASLDAVVRFVACARRAPRRLPRPMHVIVGALFERVLESEEAAARAFVPDRFWSAGTLLEGRRGAFRARGGVAMHVSGRSRRTVGEPRARGAEARRAPQSLGTARLMRALPRGPTLIVSVLLALLAAPAMVGQVLAFRAVVEANHRLTIGYQRLGAVGSLLAIYLLTMMIGYGASLADARLGRILEFDLRRELFVKLRRLPERYFRSRPTSDTIERAHALRVVGGFPAMLSGAVRALSSLLATGAAIAWLAPDVLPFVLCALVIGIALPFLARPVLRERELGLRAQTVALVRLYQDAILGNTVVRAHGAERSVEQMHEELLGQWAVSLARYRRLTMLLEAFGSAIGIGLAAASLQVHFDGAGTVFANGVLLALWLAQLPGLSSALLQATAALPAAENAGARIFELLDAREVEDAAVPSPSVGGTRDAMAIAAEGVSVEAGGQPILRDVELELRAGAHVAVVGRSGAGKSTLVSLLLGLVEPARGRLVVDGRPVEAQGSFEHIRRETAWVAPETRLWRGTILSNVSYGANGRSGSAAEAIRDVDMGSAVSHLPAGLQSAIGEDGLGLSGGEAQRLRLARARVRDDARLVILDEAFRGLPREQRRAYLESARTHWARATLVAVTHDVDDTTTFDRVLVLEEGVIVEDGAPAELLARPESLYGRLVSEARSTRAMILESTAWVRVTVGDGRITREAS